MHKSYSLFHATLAPTANICTYCPSYLHSFTAKFSFSSFIFQSSSSTLSHHQLHTPLAFAATDPAPLQLQISSTTAVASAWRRRLLQLLFIAVSALNRNMASTTITKFAHLQIPLEDVVKATDNFHHDNIIGYGGLGHVYKGRIQWSGELIKIAALRLDHKLGEGDVEFWTEISMLSDLKHTNIVSLIGFCNENDENVIVTTYAAKGSLKEHLNNPDLTWTQKLKICVGVARALSYLRYDEKRGYGVINLNINSSTILLDENWEAKLSGFKVSIKQSLNRIDNVILCEPIGTIGYIDPEIEKTKGVTFKSDIYAFGVVLFEVLCGMRADIKNETHRFLARLAKYHYENETLPDIIHPDLKNQMSRYQIPKINQEILENSILLYKGRVSTPPTYAQYC